MHEFIAKDICPLILSVAHPQGHMLLLPLMPLLLPSQHIARVLVVKNKAASLCSARASRVTKKYALTWRQLPQEGGCDQISMLLDKTRIRTAEEGV
jgi:hypothetical protein